MCLCFFTVQDIPDERRKGLKHVHSKLVEYLGNIKSLL